MKLEDQMNLSLKTGHLVRQIDAVIEGLSVMRERLAEIPERYCEKDGSELVYEREVEGKNIKIDVKRCVKCGSTYGFPRI